MSSIHIPNQMLHQLSTRAANKGVPPEHLATYAIEQYLSNFSDWRVSFSKFDNHHIRVTLARDEEVIYDYWPAEPRTFPGSRCSLDIEGQGEIPKSLVAKWIASFPVQRFYDNNQYPYTLEAGRGIVLTYRANLGVKKDEAENFLRCCSAAMEQLVVLSLKDMPTEDFPGMGFIRRISLYDPPGGHPLMVYVDENREEYHVAVTQKAKEQSFYFPKFD